MARNIINISLPAAMVQDVRREVKRRRYASISEFFRDLLREYEEQRILARLEQSRKEILAGKGKELRSLADLD